MLDVKQSGAHLGQRQSLMLQSYSSAKREMKFWCVSGGGGEWLVINTWHTTAPFHNPLKKFFFFFREKNWSHSYPPRLYSNGNVSFERLTVSLDIDISGTCVHPVEKCLRLRPG